MRTDLSNETISQALERVAELLELDGASPDRIGAHRQGAGVIRRCPRPLVLIVEEEGVEGLHRLGLGYLIGGLVTDWVRSGELALLRRLEAAHPPGCRLRRVPGIGPRLARVVHQTLGVESLHQLEEAARDGRLGQVCGFGPRRVAVVTGALGSMLHSGAHASSRRPLQLALEMGGEPAREDTEQEAGEASAPVGGGQRRTGFVGFSAAPAGGAGNRRTSRT